MQNLLIKSFLIQLNPYNIHRNLFFLRKSILSTTALRKRDVDSNSLKLPKNQISDPELKKTVNLINALLVKCQTVHFITP